MWARYFSVAKDFDGVQKTKGHATREDVHNGVTTEWERKGNNHADHFAKEGAKMHTNTELMVAADTAMKSIHEQNIKWVVKSHKALQANAGKKEPDAEAPERKKAKRMGRFAMASGESWRTLRKRKLTETLKASALIGDAGASFFREHHLRSARIDERGREQEVIIYCERCGAYFWRKTSQLHRVCRPGSTQGLRQQLSRIRRGLSPFAGTTTVRINTNQVLSAPQAAMLVTQLEEQANEYDARQQPRKRLREMLDRTPGVHITDEYSKCGVLLHRYGLRLDQVTRICEEVGDARKGAKRRRLAGKQKGRGALS